MWQFIAAIFFYGPSLHLPLRFYTVRREQIIASIPKCLLHYRISWAPGRAGQEEARQGPPTCPINCQTTLIAATCYKGPLSHTPTPPGPVTLLSAVIKCLSYASLNIAVNPTLNCSIWSSSASFPSNTLYMCPDTYTSTPPQWEGEVDDIPPPPPPRTTDVVELFPVMCYFCFSSRFWLADMS